MIGVDEDMTGLKYGLAFLAGDSDETNDKFHQFVLDAAYDKERVHSGESVYKAKNRELCYV